MNLLKRLRLSMLLLACANIAIGLALLLVRSISVYAFIYTLAAMLAVAGALHVIDYLRSPAVTPQSNNLMIGILLGLVSLFFLFRTELAVSVWLILLGFSAIVSTAYKVQSAVLLHKHHSRAWIPVIAAAVICLLVSIGFLENSDPFAVILPTTRIAFAGLAFAGLSDVAIMLFLARRARAKHEAGPQPERLSEPEHTAPEPSEGIVGGDIGGSTPKPPPGE